MNIKELELFTPNLEAQSDFYSKKLGLKTSKKTADLVSFEIGSSVLKFKEREEFTPYHFAINIPAGKEKEALNWLKNRVPIIKDGKHEIQEFDFWDASAVYFYDADGNIVELIARRRLKNYSTDEFDQNSFIEISEIGLPTTDIKREYKILNDATGIPIYSGNLERFCSAGDDSGLFIIINKNIKKVWFPTNDKPYSSDFKITFSEKGKKFSFRYEEEKLILIKAPNS